MRSFIYNCASSRIIFGAGKISSLSEELARQGSVACLLLCTSSQVHQATLLEAQLKGKVAGIFAEATMHTPISITSRAIEYVMSIGADSLVSVGGGSTIGLGKAISFRTGLAHICVPTTYAGSEMTAILGETEEGRKTTKSDPGIRPVTVIYDVDMTVTLPIKVSILSGINAIAHAVEALYAEDSNPMISLLALEGIEVLAKALPRIKDSSSDMDARSAAQYGAWLCGICLGSVGMALHHKLCHTLGGTFGLPHAGTHTVMLPHVLSYNAPEIPEVMRKLADVVPGSKGDAIHGLNVLLKNLEVPHGLQDLGFQEQDIEKAVDIALTNPYYNPRKIEREPLIELLNRAYRGEDARADL